MVGLLVCQRISGRVTASGEVEGFVLGVGAIRGGVLVNEVVVGGFDVLILELGLVGGGRGSRVV